MAFRIHEDGDVCIDAYDCPPLHASISISLLDDFALLRAASDEPENGTPDGGDSYEPTSHPNSVIVLRDSRAVPPTYSSVFLNPERWRVAMMYVSDFLSVSPLDADVGICSMCTALSAVGGLAGDPDANKIFPVNFPWADLEQIWNVFTRGDANLAANVAIHDGYDLLHGIQQELFLIKNAWDHVADQGGGCLDGVEWTATKKLTELLLTLTSGLVETRFEVKFSRRLNQLKQLLYPVDFQLDFLPECRRLLVDLLKNRTDVSNWSLQAALAFLRIDLVAVLTDKGLVLPGVLNFFVDLDNHISEKGGAEKAANFFVMLLAEEERIFCALSYWSCYDAETASADFTEDCPRAVELGQIIAMFSRNIGLPEAWIRSKVSLAFPVVEFNVRGFLLFAASLHHCDKNFLIRSGKWVNLLGLVRLHPWKNPLEIRCGGLSVVHLAALSWASNKSGARDDLNFVVKSVTKIASKRGLSERVRTEISDLLKPLSREKLSVTFEAFCQERRARWGKENIGSLVCPDYVRFVGRMIPEETLNQPLDVARGLTALHVSARAGFSELVRFLVEEMGADPSIECGGGKLAKVYAESNANFDARVLSLLSASGTSCKRRRLSFHVRN